MKIIMEKLTSRGALIVILLIICFLFGLFFYAVSRNAEVIFSKNGLFKIIPKGSERIKELEGVLAESVSLAEYEKLQKQYQQLNDENLILSSSYTRILAASGVDARYGEEGAIRKIELLAARSKEIGRDISVSLSIIQIEVMRGRTINTNSLHMDETKRGLYMDIQKFFRCIGIYNGKINGDQAATCRAVKQFQEKYGLEDDGIIGPITFGAMEKALEEAKLH